MEIHTPYFIMEVRINKHIWAVVLNLIEVYKLFVNSPSCIMLVIMHVQKGS